MTTRLDPSRLVPAHLAPTLLRLALGAIFLFHGWTKLTVFTLPGTAAFFELHGFPGWTAYPVVAAELLGGLALLLGFRVRWAALGLVPVMLGAIKPHLANGFSFSAPNGGWEFPALLLVLLVVQVGLGAGAYALDAVVGRAPHRPALRAA